MVGLIVVYETCLFDSIVVISDLHFIFLGNKHDGMLIVYGINLSMHHLNRKIMAGVVKDLHQMA